MTKKTLLLFALVAGIVIILVIVANTQQQGTTSDTPPEAAISDGDTSPDAKIAPSSPADSGEDEMTDDTPDQPETSTQPSPIARTTTKAGLDAILFADKSDSMTELLAPEIVEELNESAISSYQPPAEPIMRLEVQWTDDEVTAPLDLPGEAPVYEILRPAGGDLKSLITNLAANLGINGHLVRVNEQEYVLMDIVGGDYSLAYNLFHMIFETHAVDIGLADSTVETVAKTLREAGVLGFAYNAEEIMDDFGNQWIRFQPDLSLPVYSLETPLLVNTFEPAADGVVDILINDESSIVEIHSRFPNVSEAQTVRLQDSDSIIALTEAGDFQKGKIELLHPGAIAVSERRSFYAQQNEQDIISIEQAELSSVECGYLFETSPVPQALIVPSCKVVGIGRAGDYDVIFQGVISAVNPDQE